MNAKVISNQMAVITTITLDEIKKLQAEKPEALCLYEGEGKEKKMVFRVMAGETGNVSNLGICFDSETNDENKFAVVTLDLSGKPEGEDVTEYAAKRYGRALKALSKVEGQFGEALTAIDVEAEELRNMIQIAL